MATPSVRQNPRERATQRVPEGCIYWLSSCTAEVLVDQSPQPVSSLDCSAATGLSGRGSPDGTIESETPVRSLGVVMVHVVAKHAFEMAPSPDQHVIEALLANGPHPTFGKGVGLRRPVGRSHHPKSLRAKDLVEGAAELGVSVTDEGEDIFESPVDGEVSGLLR